MNACRVWRTVCLLSAFIMLLGGALAAFAAEPVEVDAGRVKALMDADEAIVIFPLSPVEFNNLHIKGSVNVPIAEIPAGLPADKRQPLVFYCLGNT